MSQPNDVDAVIEAEVCQLIPDALTSELDRRTACEFLRKLVEQYASELSPNDLSDALNFFPLSLLADLIGSIDSLPLAQIAEIIADPDPIPLVRRIRIFEYLLRDDTPLHTRDDLAKRTLAFHRFCDQHQNYLVEHGLPPRCFSFCRWLYVHLGRLYDTRTTSSPHPFEELWPDSPHVDSQPAYTWLPKTAWDTKFKYAYNEAALLSGMHPADADQIERDRERIFTIRQAVLELLGQALGTPGGNPDGLRSQCLQVLTQALDRDAIDFYFRMDRYYLGTAATDAENGLPPTPDPQMSPGGLTNLLGVIGHVEAELQYRTYDAAKRSMPSWALALRGDSDNNHPCRYFSVIDGHDRDQLDKVLDDVGSSVARQQPFWQQYRQWLSKEIEQEFQITIPVRVLGKHAEAIAGMITYQVEQLVERLERGEDMLPAPPADFIFRKKGAYWNICYNGGELHSIPDLVGLEYLWHLLASPTAPVSHLKLEQMRQDEEFDPQSRTLLGAKSLGQAPEQKDGEIVQPWTFPTSEFVFDEKDETGIQQCKDRLQQIADDCSEARERGDDVEVDQLKEEEQTIGKMLEEAFGPGAPDLPVSEIKRCRQRSFTRSGLKTARDNVRKTIKEAIEKLKEMDVALGVHLDNCVDRKSDSNTITYHPEPPISWKLQ